MPETKAEAGWKLNPWRTPEAQWQSWKPDQQAVAPACVSKSGKWYCLTCDEILPNNLTADSHVESGDHVMAWLCPHHGVEATS